MMGISMEEFLSKAWECEHHVEGTCNAIDTPGGPPPCTECIKEDAVEEDPMNPDAVITAAIDKWRNGQEAKVRAEERERLAKRCEGFAEVLCSTSTFEVELRDMLYEIASEFRDMGDDHA